MFLNEHLKKPPTFRFFPSRSSLPPSHHCSYDIGNPLLFRAPFWSCPIFQSTTPLYIPGCPTYRHTPSTAAPRILWNLFCSFSIPKPPPLPLSSHQSRFHITNDPSLPKLVPPQTIDARESSVLTPDTASLQVTCIMMTLFQSLAFMWAQSQVSPWRQGPGCQGWGSTPLKWKERKINVSFLR